MSKRLLLVLISLCLLSGCGFKLRGSYPLSAQFSQISILGEERQLVARLAAILASNGATVVAAGSASPTLSLSRSEFMRQTASADATGIATRFDYSWLVEFSVLDADGAILLSGSPVSVSDTLEYDPDDEPGFEREEEFLREQMEQEIALQIMRQLSRL